MKNLYGIQVHYELDTGGTDKTSLAVLYEVPPDQAEVDRQVAAWVSRMAKALADERIWWGVSRVCKARVLEYHLQPAPIEEYRERLEQAIGQDPVECRNELLPQRNGAE